MAGWRDAPIVDDTAPATSWRDAPAVDEAEAKQPWGDYLADLGMQAAQGLTFGFSDRIAAGVGAGANKVARYAGYDVEPTDYSTLLRKFQQINEQFEKKNPKAALGAELAGGLAGGIATMPARFVERAAARVPTWLGRTSARGAMYGAPYGALSELGTSEDLTERPLEKVVEGAGKGALAGAVAGPVLEGLGSAAARVIGPWASDDAQRLIDRDIPLTFGETMGGGFKTAEDKLSSLPLTGYMVREAKARSREGLNRAATDDVLEPLGLQSNRALPVGHELIDETHRTLSGMYRTIEPNIVARLDGPLLATITAERAALPQSVQADFTDAMIRHIGNVTHQGTMLIPGRDFLQGTRALNEESRRLITGGASLPYAYDLGQALGRISNALTQSAYRHSPHDVMTALRSTNAAYSRLKRVEKAASSVAAEDGVFTPAMLHSSVKALDRSKDKSRFGRGTALMQDLSQPAKNAMGGNYPDSGTPGRILFDAMLHGGGWAAMGPAALAPEVAGMLLYSQPFQTLLRRAAAGSPQARTQLANVIRQIRDRARPGIGTFAGEESQKQFMPE